MLEKRRVRPIRSTEIRKVNERILLNLLYNNGILSQADLAAETGLQPSTVFRIFSDLRERGVIREVESQQPEENRKGRRPSFFALNPEAGYAVGVDLATGHAAILLVDFSGQAVTERVLDFASDVDGKTAIERIAKGIREMVDEEGLLLSDLIGVGIGAPGVVDISTGRVVYYARFPGMEGAPIREILQEALGVPIHVHNNASVVALSEYRYGRAKKTSNLVAFLLRAGLGAAYIRNGTIFTSQDRTAFEAGHMFLNLACTSEGEALSLEDVLSEGALLRRVQERGRGYATIPELLDGLRRGDRDVSAALSEAAEVLVQVVRNIALLLNPESFLLITRFQELSEFFAATLEERMSQLPGAERFNLGKVVPVEYDPIIACKGAAHLVFDAFFHAS